MAILTNYMGVSEKFGYWLKHEKHNWI
jgi:hypothetical protein